MKIFLSGPMTGYPHFNHGSFHALSATLRSMGYEVFSPAENLAPAKDTWLEWMKISIVQVIECDVVLAMNGYEFSKGCRAETELAKNLNIPVVYFAQPFYLERLVKLEEQLLSREQ